MDIKFENPLEPVDHSFVKNKHLDIKYADESGFQKLDLYLPEENDNPTPLIIFIHGGAFCMCDKADRQVQPYLQATNLGYAVASVNYRLSGEAVFPAGVHDVKAAVRFLRANADKYNLDPDSFVAAGGSAGGYYTAMLGVLSGRNELEDLFLGNADISSDVQACVAWYPPTDFIQMDPHLKQLGLFPQDHNDPDSPESRFMGGTITDMDSEYLQSASPLTYVHKNMPPILLQHGRVDNIVPFLQSEIFAEKIRTVCGDNTVICEIFDTADHADAQFETDENMKRIFKFIKAQNRRNY